MKWDAGDAPLTWNDRELQHEQSSYWNYLLCQSAGPGLLLCREESRNLQCILLGRVHVCQALDVPPQCSVLTQSSANTPGVLKRISFMSLVFSWRIQVVEEPRSEFIPTGFLV